jgi:hypothetical protein
VQGVPVVEVAEVQPPQPWQSVWQLKRDSGLHGLGPVVMHSRVQQQQRRQMLQTKKCAP